MCNRVRKNLTLDSNLCKLSEIKAQQMGLNLSSYINVLMYNDLNNVVKPQQTETPKNIEEIKDPDLNNGLTDLENNKMIDDFLGGFEVGR